MPKVERKTYSHARHVDRVIKGSNARCSNRAILLEICRRADFSEPTSTFTKGQLEKTTGYNRKTVRLALNWLRAEGSIVPVAHFEGGRGNAVTYRLDVVGQGAEDSKPADAQDGGGREMPIAEFSELVRVNGYAAAMHAKREYEAM